MLSPSKNDKIPFLHIGINSKYDKDWFSSIGSIDYVSFNAGYFLFKKKKVESTISLGPGFFFKQTPSFCGEYRLVYKPTEWIGVGTSYCVNLNRENNSYSGLRLFLHFSNGL